MIISERSGCWQAGLSQKLASYPEILVVGRRPQTKLGYGPSGAQCDAVPVGFYGAWLKLE